MCLIHVCVCYIYVFDTCLNRCCSKTQPVVRCQIGLDGFRFRLDTRLLLVVVSALLRATLNQAFIPRMVSYLKLQMYICQVRVGDNLAYTGNTYPCCRVLVTLNPLPPVDTVTVNSFQCLVCREENKHKIANFNWTPKVHQISSSFVETGCL